jgi:hypothetical protein
MTGPYDLLNRLAPGALPASELPDRDRKPDPWESSMQATCECLSWRGTLDNLERRQAEDALGQDCYSAFPMHARPAVVTAHSLLTRGAFSEAELAARMDRVRARLRKDS